MDQNSPSPEQAPEPTSGEPCRHLRHKGMYVYTDGLSGGSHGDYDNTIFWCLKTMKSFGPDDDIVDREGCCQSGRACHEPI